MRGEVKCGNIAHCLVSYRLYVNAAEVLRMPEHSNSPNRQREMIVENKSPSTSRMIRNFNFDEFADKDPYEREGEYQRLLKLKE